MNVRRAAVFLVSIALLLGYAIHSNHLVIVVEENREERPTNRPLMAQARKPEASSSTTTARPSPLSTSAIKATTTTMDDSTRHFDWRSLLQRTAAFPIFTPHDIDDSRRDVVAHSLRTLWKDENLPLIETKHNLRHFSKCDVRFDESTCRGKLVCELKSDVCNSCRGKTLSKDREIDNFLKETIGPLGLRVAVEGTDVAMGRTVFISEACRYESFFEVHSQQHKSSDYRLTVKVDTDVCRGYDDTAPTVTSFANHYVFRGSPNMKCKSRGTMATSSIFSDVIWSSASTTTESLQNLRNVATHFTHPMRGDTFRLHIRGTPLRQWTYSKDDIEQCISGLGRFIGGVLFIGDSQIRTLYRHYDAIMKQTRASQAKGFNMTSTYSKSHRARFQWDPYLKILSDELRLLLGSYDVIVFGFGAWPASFGQWDLAKYLQYTSQLFDRITREMKQQTHLKVFWAASPAWPKPRYGTEGFRITNTRLGLWNGLTRRLLNHQKMQQQSNNNNNYIRVLDFFEISWPHIKLHRGDGMHYDHSVVLYGAIDMILSEVCNNT
eukprot:PhM_4_TR18672/c0_g1_i1/m.71152